MKAGYLPISESGEWLKEWAKYFLTTENTDCASAQRFLKGFSVFSVHSVVKVSGKPTQLSTLRNRLSRTARSGYGHAMHAPGHNRDRRLVEYVLSLPAHQLYRHGRYKNVLRTAMQGILPEPVRTRTHPTTLLALLARGVKQNGEALLAYAHASQASWCKYVRADWLEQHWNVPVTIENDGAWAVIPWLCASYATWLSTFVDPGVNYVR